MSWWTVLNLKIKKKNTNDFFIKSNKYCIWMGGYLGRQAQYNWNINDKRIS